jgi:hypothetical protein
MEYMSCPEAAEKWGISERRVQILCKENRIPGVSKIGYMWLIPKSAVKPFDKRIKRTVQIKFRVTEEERAFIEQKMQLVPTRNMEAYLRKMAIDGYIIQIDHADIKAMTAEIQKIGVNVNQIAKRVNATGSVYQEDIEEIKEVLAEIWRLQRLSLLKAR